MRNYELLLIISPEVAEEDIPGTIDKVGSYLTAKGGTIGETTRWGKKKLAYPIDRHKEGNYVLARLEMEPDHVAELEANLRISEKVLRHLVVRLDA